MPGTISEVIIEDFKNAKTSIQDAVRTRTFLYPFKGIIFLATHKPIQPPLTTRVTKTLTIGIGVTGLLFLFTYVPQTAVLALTNGPLVAPFSAALLVLSESSSITQYLARTFLSMQDGLRDTFDATLVAREKEKLVFGSGSGGGKVEIDLDSEEQEEQQQQQQPSSNSKQSWISGLPFFSFLQPKSLVRTMIYWPLNFVPVVGTALYVVLQGVREGPVAHERYFQLKGWKKERRRVREAWILRHRGGYTSFGIAAFLLEMAPFGSMVFSFTNAVGAALWAADIEDAIV